MEGGRCTDKKTDNLLPDVQFNPRFRAPQEAASSAGRAAAPLGEEAGGARRPAATLIVTRVQLHRVRRAGVHPGAAVQRQPQFGSGKRPQQASARRLPAAVRGGGAAGARVLRPGGRRKGPAPRKRDRSWGSAAGGGGEAEPRGEGEGGRDATVRKPRTPPIVCTPRSVCHGWLKKPRARRARGEGRGGERRPGVRPREGRRRERRRRRFQHEEESWPGGQHEVSGGLLVPAGLAWGPPAHSGLSEETPAGLQKPLQEGPPRPLRLCQCH